MTVTAATELPAEPAQEATTRAHAMRRLFRDKVALAAAVTLALIALAAIFAPWIAPYDPYLTDLSKVIQPPSDQHWFGTDNTGRDILSRVIYGTRNTSDDGSCRRADRRHAGRRDGHSRRVLSRARRLHHARWSTSCSPSPPS
jgi:hypothetical protein